MQKGAASNTDHKKTKRSPSSSVESRENQLISLAVDLAEKQLMEGTASSQVITHYLRLGSTKERLEKEALEKKVKLLEAKTESLQSAKNSEELYKSAIEAMMSYGGRQDGT
jgi:predicted transcriptional regulator